MGGGGIYKEGRDPGENRALQLPPSTLDEASPLRRDCNLTIAGPRWMSGHVVGVL